MRSDIRIIRTLVLCTLVAFSAQAQSSPIGNAINTSLGAACPQIAAELIERPDMAPVFKARPIDKSAVCACTMTAFNADQRLQDIFGGEAQAVQESLKSDHLKAYITVRLLHSVLSCMTPELESSLAATKPVQ